MFTWTLCCLVAKMYTEQVVPHRHQACTGSQPQVGGLLVQVIVEPQEFERLQKLKEWDFVDTFTDAEVERWVPCCHTSSHLSQGHPSRACCSRTLLSASPPGASDDGRGSHDFSRSAFTDPSSYFRWCCCCLQVAHVH